MTPLEIALAAIDEAIVSLDDKQLLVAAKCKGLMRGYSERWGVPDFDVVSVEQTVTAPLYNPATQARSRTFTAAGKIDMIVERGGKRVLIDHKTTSEDIKDPAGPYWRQLVVEAQPSHYDLLEWLNGRKIDENLWDVVKKPDIRPKQVAKRDRDEVIRYRYYFGFPVSNESINEMEHTERESLEMYEYRLAHDCTKERPESYFQRRTVPRLDSEIHEHAVELWDYSQEIILARRENRHPRNSGACMTWGRPCKFLGICSGYDDPTSNNWKTKEQVHNELTLIGTDGRDVLTNSRLTTFKTCRRKHQLAYEIGIERIDEEEAEALFFGTVWHIALEKYFEAWKEETDNVNATGVAANEVAIASRKTQPSIDYTIGERASE